MVTGSSLLALAMTAAVGAGPADEPISCQVRLLTMDGLGWRSDYYPRLQPVARQGTSSVWTADRALAETMTGRAITATVAPVCTNPGQTTVDMKATTSYVAHLERLADGPKNQATAIAFMPETASVEEGFRANVSGRKLDQGVLARVAIEESHVRAMHVVRMTERYVQAEGQTPPKVDSAAEVIDQFVKAVGEKAVGKPEPKVALEVQVPEVSHAKVEGEWLVPRDGVLLVSLGIETVADDGGKAVARERIAILEVAPGPPGPALARTIFDRHHPLAAPSPMARAAMPAIPARALPLAVAPDGRVVDLPPVPEAEASADLDRIKPAPDRPSPQAIHASAPAVARDHRVARTGLEAPIEFGRTSSAPARPTMPAIPARSIPVAVAPDGQVVDLPPLPEAVASADLNRINPDPALPSGQAAHVVSGPILDAQLARTRFEPTDQSEARCSIGQAGAPTSTIPGLVSRLIQKLSEIDVECDDALSPIGQHPAEKDAATFEERLACAMPDCKACEAFTAANTPAQMTLGVTMKDQAGRPVVDSTSRLESALKTPGKTETRYIPVGGRFALEIKATLVPAPAGVYKEVKKGGDPGTNP